jgi:predicted NAD/FAD-binding protein
MPAGKAGTKGSVCVVGSGIGGISAAYHLVTDGFKVELHEAGPEVGGHTHAMEIDGEQVDLGFMMSVNPNRPTARR